MRVAVAAGLLLALLGSLSGERTAVAATPTDVEQQAHFDRGLALYDAGDYDRAALEFEAAFAVKRHPDLLINIAATYERLYRPNKAREAYERFLASDAPAESDLRKLADKRLRILRVLPGSILVDADRPGALVILGGSDGEKRGTSPVTFSELPPGRYHVHVEDPCCVPIDTDVTLAPGISQAITQRLLRETETLTVFSTPDGAHVFVDNRDTGEITPFSRSYEVGRHELRLELPDRRPHVEQLTLGKGAPLFRSIVLPAPPRSGRTEMLIAGMAFGGYAAPALTVAIAGTRITTGNNLAIVVPVAIAGVGLGFVTSWLLTDESMKVGHSSIIAGATIWGGLAGTSLAFGLGLTGNEQRLTQQNTLALSLLGGGLGLGAGVLTAWLNDTSAGDAAIVNSGALWGTMAMALLTESISFRNADHDRAFGWLTLGGNVLGLTTGALLAWGFETSRSQVAVVDAMGLLGAMLGYGIGYAAGQDANDPNSGTVCLNDAGRCVSGARYALGGLTLGLLAAGLITRRLHFEVPKTEALLQRHHDRWALGLPNLRLGVTMTPRGPDQQAIVDLARGEW